MPNCEKKNYYNHQIFLMYYYQCNVKNNQYLKVSELTGATMLFVTLPPEPKYFLM